MKAMLVVFVLGIALVALNEAVKPPGSRVVTKYIPRDMDAWFKDPENQPLFMYSGMFADANVRTY